MPIKSSIYNVCLGQAFAQIPENWNFKILSNAEIGKKGWLESNTYIGVLAPHYYKKRSTESNS